MVFINGHVIGYAANSRFQPVHNRSIRLKEEPNGTFEERVYVGTPRTSAFAF